ncbi:hypothetical protein [Pseudomonas fluorescens]
MNASLIGALIGGLIITFLVSRALFLVTKSWNGGIQKLCFIHLVSLGIAVLLGGMGMADEGAFAPIKALQIYLIPQCVWMIVDAMRLRRTEKTS